MELVTNPRCAEGRSPYFKDTMTTPVYRPFRGLNNAASPPGRRWNRRRFIGACVAAWLAPVVRAQAPGGNVEYRGGKVEWARLHNPGQYWNRHANADPELLDFIRRNSTLNIDPTWQAASAKTLPGLCNYPFLFTDRVENLDSNEGRNLAEYLRRGGFLFVDCCCNTGINPSLDGYLVNQIKFLSGILPEARVEPLAESDEVYTVFFKMKRHPPRIMASNTMMSTRPFPFHGIYRGAHLNGMISMSGLQCGWAHVDTPAIAQESLEMMTNIYIYAMTR